MGSSVNMSARLMGQAIKIRTDGPVVLVDERTRNAAASKCSFRKLEKPIRLKGVNIPQTVYEVVKEDQMQHDVRMRFTEIVILAPLSTRLLILSLFCLLYYCVDIFKSWWQWRAGKDFWKGDGAYFYDQLHETVY